MSLEPDKCPGPKNQITADRLNNMARSHKRLDAHQRRVCFLCEEYGIDNVDWTYIPNS